MLSKSLGPQLNSGTKEAPHIVPRVVFILFFHFLDKDELPGYLSHTFPITSIPFKYRHIHRHDQRKLTYSCTITKDTKDTSNISCVSFHHVIRKDKATRD